MTIDIHIEDQGTVVGFTPVTDAGKAWLDDNLQAEPWQYLGRTVVVDHRYATDIILGIINDTDLVLN